MDETITIDAITELNEFNIIEYNAEKNLVVATKEKRKLKLRLLKSGFILVMDSQGAIFSLHVSTLEWNEGCRTFPFEGKSQTLRRIQEALSDGLPLNLRVYADYIIKANREV